MLAADCIGTNSQTEPTAADSESTAGPDGEKQPVMVCVAAVEQNQIEGVTYDGLIAEPLQGTTPLPSTASLGSIVDCKLSKNWLIGMDAKSDMPWKHIFDRVKMGMSARSHFRMEDESRNMHVCFCVLKTHRTHADILARLTPFGCKLVERLEPRFSCKDERFVHLAKSKKLVFEFGFESEQLMYSMPESQDHIPVFDTLQTSIETEEGGTPVQCIGYVLPSTHHATTSKGAQPYCDRLHIPGMPFHATLAEGCKGKRKAVEAVLGAEVNKEKKKRGRKPGTGKKQLLLIQQKQQQQQQHLLHKDNVNPHLNTRVLDDGVIDGVGSASSSDDDEDEDCDDKSNCSKACNQDTAARDGESRSESCSSNSRGLLLLDEDSKDSFASFVAENNAGEALNVVERRLKSYQKLYRKKDKALEKAERQLNEAQDELQAKSKELSKCKVCFVFF